MTERESIVARVLATARTAWRAGRAFHHDLWRTRARRQPLLRRIAITVVRVLVLTARGFTRDRCMVNASALTYYTVLSIVPVFALAFGIAKGFKLEDLLNEVISTKLQGQQEVVQRVTEFSQNLLQSTSGGVIAGIGVLVLFWSVISLMGNIEQCLNAIWGVTRGRHIGRKFTDYLSFALLAPLLFIVSSSLTVTINEQVVGLMSRFALLGAVAPLVTSALKLTSYVLAWVLFAFIYVFMPNTHVRVRDGIVGGVAGGSLFVLTQILYVSFQVGVSKYNAIYGSFAALPLFLIWLQLSWVIVLLGAELTHACAMTETHEFARECDSASHSFRLLVALRVAHLAVTRFAAGEPPLSAREIAESLGLPVRLADETLDALTGSGILSEVLSTGKGPHRYQPARDTQALTAAAVATALDKCGFDTIPLDDSETTRKLAGILKSFGEGLATSPANVLLKDIS